MGLKATAKRRPKKGRGKKTTRKAAAKAPAATSPSLADANLFRVTRQQLGKLMGVHADTVTDYTRAGMPILVRGGAGKEGVYDAVACLDWWRLQPQGKATNAKDAAQTRAYDATAALNELKLQEQRGELVHRDQVALEGQHFTAAWRAKILALPRLLAHTGVIDAEKEQAVGEVLRDLLREVASWRTIADLKAVADGAAA